MAYTSKIRALDAICRIVRRQRRPQAGRARAQRVVRPGRRRRRPCAQRPRPRTRSPPPRRRGGHIQEIRALNAIARPARRRGRPPPQPRRPRRDRRPRAGGGWSAGPVRLFGAGDSRFADGRQGTPPYDSGYVLHRYSALNLAVWALRGKVEHDARRDLFATSGATLQQWIDTHLAGLLEAMADSANPVVAGASRHPQPARRAAGRDPGSGRHDHRRADRSRRAGALAPGEPALGVERPRPGERTEAARLQRLAGGAGERARRPVQDAGLPCRNSPPTARPRAPPRSPVCSATTSTTPRPAPSSRRRRSSA